MAGSGKPHVDIFPGTPQLSVYSNKYHLELLTIKI